MEMNKICTSQEQSQKLIELGIDVNTADMCYCPIMNIDSGNSEGYLKVPECYPFSEVKDSLIPYLPAWSLSALSELMPLINEYNVEYRPIIERYKDDGWACKYYNEETRSTDDIYIRRYGRTPLDAAFDMVVWLKENNKL